jgi:peptide/nickel transport system permease protein
MTDQDSTNPRTFWWGLRRSPSIRIAKQLVDLRLARFGLIVLFLFVIMAAFAPWLAPMDPVEIHPRDSLQRPGSEYLLGADRLGRDQLSRLMYGARVSLSIAGLGVGAAVIAGVAIGATAGWVGKWPDEILMRIMDSLASLPNIVLALTLVAITGGAVGNIILVVALVQTPSIARVIRSQVLSERERDYVTAAISTGASPFRVLLRHVIPNTLAPVIIQASIGFGTAILLEASLSFLGVGVRAPTPTWGGMLRNAFEVVNLAPFLTFVPGLVLFIVVLSFNFVGDALRDVLDPRMRNVR